MSQTKFKQEELLNEHWSEHMDQNEYLERLYNSGQRTHARALERKWEKRGREE